MDDPSNMQGPKDAQDVPTGDPVPDSTGDPPQHMNAGNNDHDDDPAPEEMPKATAIKEAATTSPQEQHDEMEKTGEMPTDFAGLAAAVAPPGPEDTAAAAASSKMEMEEAMQQAQGTPQVPHLTAQGGPEATTTTAHANNGTLHGIEMTAPMTPEGGVPPTSPTDNPASPSNMMMPKHAVAAMTDNNNEDEDEGDDDDEEEDQVQENSRRPDNEWQPPKKRRRKPEPMKPFNDMLYELLVYRQKEGHCRVPLDAKTALGRWVASLRTQKSNLRKGYHSLDLSEERLKVLNSIGFVWDLQQFDSDSRWKRQFEELAAFKAEHG